MGKIISKETKLNGVFSWAGLLLFYLLCGALLFFLPEQAFKITSILIGFLFCLIGVINSVHYFMIPVEESGKTLELGTGLMQVFFGILFLLSPKSFEALLCYVWAVSILMGAFAKIQLGVTALRLKEKKWWLYFALAAVSCVMGFLAFFGVMGTKVQNDSSDPSVTLGIFLWVEAAMDIFCVIYTFLKMKKKNENKAPEAAQQTAADATTKVAPEAVPDAASQAAATNETNS